MIVFFLVFTFIITGMHCVCFWQSFGYNTLLLKLLPLCMGLAFMFLMSVIRNYYGFGASYINILIHSWLGFIFLWFCVSMLFLFLKLCRLNLPQYFSLITAAILSIFAFWTAFKTPHIKEIEIKNPKIKKALTIAQISDTHLGKDISPERFKKALQKLAVYKPDFIFFTGDIFEETQNMQPYINLIKDLKAPCGKYVVSGNHEYYGGLAENKKLFNQAGLIDLDNKTTESCNLIINGVSDIPDKNFLDKLEKQERFSLLLSHQPKYFDEVSPKIDLMLSGHTHAGQIWPFNYFVALRYKYINGLYRKGGSNLYVNPGTFYWGPPMRLFTNNEITVFKLNEN